MKKHLLATAICLSSLVFANDNTSWNTSPQDLVVVPSAQLTEAELLQISEGQHPELAVEFAAGSILPITFYLSGDLASLAESYEKWGSVQIQQTFYVRCFDEELFFSSDLTEWKTFFEFATGSAGIQLEIRDGTPVFVVGSETNRRS